jgi:hypothetical protein
LTQSAKFRYAACSAIKASTILDSIKGWKTKFKNTARVGTRVDLSRAKSRAGDSRVTQVTTRQARLGSTRFRLDRSRVVATLTSTSEPFYLHRRPGSVVRTSHSSTEARHLSKQSFNDTAHCIFHLVRASIASSTAEETSLRPKADPVSRDAIFSHQTLLCVAVRIFQMNRQFRPFLRL